MNGNKIFNGIGWSLVERMSAQLVMFLVSMVLARILNPEDYGILALINVFVTVADALVVGGFGTALVQKKDCSETDFNSMFWLSIGIAILLYLALFLGAPFIAEFYENQDLILVTRVLGIRLVFSAINSIQQAYIQRYMQFKKLFVTSTAAAVISGISGIVAALAGMKVWALLVQQLMYIGISTLLLSICIEWKPKFSCSLDCIKEMWGYGSKVFLATAVDTLKDNIRSLVVGKVFSEKDLAFYNQGKKFPQLIVSEVVNSVGKVLLPAFSEQQDNKERNKELMRVSIRISSFIVLPMVFGLIGVADVFIELLLTEKWLPCVTFLRILSLVYISRSINTIMKNALLSIGKSGINLFHEIVTSILTILMIFMAAFWLKSVELIAWSYVIVSFVGTIIFSYFVVKEYRYKVVEIIRDYLPSLVLAAVMSGIVYTIGILQFHIMLKLVVQVIVGIIIYLGIAKMLKLSEYVMLMDMLKKLIKKGAR